MMSKRSEGSSIRVAGVERSETKARTPHGRGLAALDPSHPDYVKTGHRSARSGVPSIPLVLVLIVATLSRAQEARLPDLNAAVLGFARERVGKKVGDGECTALARAALRAAGARSRFGPYGPDADFAWGLLVATLTPRDHPAAGILPGDVVQFRDARFVTRTRTRTATRTKTRTYPHHTAIVAAVAGRAVTVLHQNVGLDGWTDAQKKVVQEETLRLDDLRQGTLWVYRPVAE
jgi:hypothetical protein